MLVFVLVYFMSFLDLQLFLQVRESWLIWFYCFECLVTINVPWLFLTVPWVGLQRVIVVFPDHTHLLFYHSRKLYVAQSVAPQIK